MLKAVLVGVGVFFLCLCSVIIPIVHFFTVPGAPFFAGFFGIGHVHNSTDSYGVRGLKFGSLLAGIFLVVAGLAAAVVTFEMDPSQKLMVLMWGGVIIFTLYTGSMASLGAMYSSARTDRKAAEAAEQDQTTGNP